MSKWADYGFPLGDITPVSLLLEGLELALAERYACGENPIELDAIEGIDAKARRIDNLIDGIGPVDQNRGYYFATPDYFRIKDLRGLEMIAAYLGEDLVPNPGTELSPVTYAWCMQRYRMINAVYGVMCYFGFPCLNRYFYSNDTQPGEIREYGPSIYAHSYQNSWPPFYLRFTVAVYNKFPTPATVQIPFVPTGNSYQYNPFGTSCEEGKTYVYSGESTGVYNEATPLPQAARDFETMYNYLRAHEPPAVEQVFHGDYVRDPDGWPTTVFYDFRRSLEFYDDISQEG